MFLLTHEIAINYIDPYHVLQAYSSCTLVQVFCITLHNNNTFHFILGWRGFYTKLYMNKHSKDTPHPCQTVISLMECGGLCHFQSCKTFEYAEREEKNNCCLHDVIPLGSETDFNNGWNIYAVYNNS